ncbi:ABC transporter permease [Anaeromyxobacter diazotrophicus]|uniref:ABC transporter permease n=1 Tax=Anaeromyxobacter diazotrophicus TaxID=2590199 RepID=A0A7I9VI18_9BACT|nr:FtsX-like permease family protein [Anaeromyxobacter diazotrophicus]GEJ55760.1 ABC transporter permease [Anaeromyxobacter diazotrophicus]
MILVDLQIAGRNLLKHTKRNLLLGGAIATVTLLLVVMGGLTQGMRSAMLESATTLMTGHVNVGGFYKVTSGTSAPLVSDYPRVLADTRRLVPELDYFTVRVRGWAKGVSERASMDLVLGGVDIAQEVAFRRMIQVKEGDLGELAQPNTLLLFEDQARKLEVQVGDVVTLSAPTARGVNNTADLRVAAVARNIGILSSFSAFMPAETLRRLYQLNDTTTGAIHLYLKEPARDSQVAARLRSGLAQAGYRVMDPDPRPYWEKLFAKVNAEDWTGQKLDVTTWEDEMTFLSWILKAILGLTGVLIFILLVIVVVGILNTLAIAIRERTREIGTLRAIGMQRRKVLWLFLLEAALLGLCGTVAGAVAGVALCAAVDAAHLAVPESVQMFLMQQHLTLAVQAKAVLEDVLFVAAVTTLAALLPAFHAARLRPVTAMHHIG